MNEQQMIVDVLLHELKQVKKGLIRAGGISSEKVVQRELNGIYKSVDELVKATEIEIRRKIK